LILYHGFMALSGKRLLLLGFVVVLMVVIPLTVYLVQQQQKLKVGATPATTLSLVDSTTKSPAASTTVGQNVSFDVMMNPGTNQISFVKLTITYDPTKLATTSATLVPTSSFPTTLQGPTFTPNSISMTLSVGSNPQNIVSTTTKVATLTLKALDVTTTPTQVAFGPDTQVLSIASTDQFNENVLSSSTPGTVTIAQGSGVSPSPPGSAPVTGGTSGNQIPVCTTLSLDRSATGTAPYALTFTATGSDSDGTISKVTFTWGDGQVQDVTTGGGIGTKSVNLPTSHTYQNSGTFKASATLTDNSGGVSSSTSCTQTITVSSASGSSGGVSATPCPNGSSTCQVATVPSPSASASATPIATPIPIATPTPIPTLAPTGPGNTIFSVGALGVVSTIVGVILLFAL